MASGTFCPKCGYSNPPQRGACLMCYARLDLRGGGRQCPSCGGEVYPDSRFCGSCGTALEAGAVAVPAAMALAATLAEASLGYAGAGAYGAGGYEETYGPPDAMPALAAEEHEMPAFDAEPAAPAAPAEEMFVPPPPGLVSEPEEEEMFVPPPPGLVREPEPAAEVASPPPPPPETEAAIAPPPPPPDSVDLGEGEDLGWELEDEPDKA